MTRAGTAARNDSLFAVGDTHMPFHCSDTLLSILKAIEALQPRYVVQMGDLFDQYSFSRYGKSLNIATPEQELVAGLETARAFWESVRKRAPAARCYQLLGNHDTRLDKKLAEKMPELGGLVDSSSLFTFKGVESMKTDRDVLELTVQGEPWALHHGFLSKPGDHVKYFQKSCVTGHSHRAHIIPHKIHDKLLWDCNAGYAGDPTAAVFKYGATVKNAWTRGYLTIDSLGPRFVSLEAK